MGFFKEDMYLINMQFNKQKVSKNEKEILSVRY